ncbi:hypothetical protein BLOT_007254 [Blomia tropicalis]|nr:hypothetical protein BLOT_007254 [Blomia tropicalis]
MSEHPSYQLVPRQPNVHITRVQCCNRRRRPKLAALDVVFGANHNDEQNSTLTVLSSKCPMAVNGIEDPADNYESVNVIYELMVIIRLLSRHMYDARIEQFRRQSKHVNT